MVWCAAKTETESEKRAHAQRYLENRTKSQERGRGQKDGPTLVYGSVGLYKIV